MKGLKKGDDRIRWPEVNRAHQEGKKERRNEANESLLRDADYQSGNLAARLRSTRTAAQLGRRHDEGMGPLLHARWMDRRPPVELCDPAWRRRADAAGEKFGTVEYERAWWMMIALVGCGHRMCVLCVLDV